MHDSYAGEGSGAGKDGKPNGGLARHLNQYGEIYVGNVSANGTKMGWGVFYFGGRHIEIGHRGKNGQLQG